MTLKEFRLPALLLAAAVFVATAASGRVTESFSRTYPLTPGGTVSLSNLNGSVEIIGWDRAEISIEAEKSARNEEVLKRIEILVDAESDRIVIKTRHGKSTDSWWGVRKSEGGSVRYKLHVPAELARLKVDVMNANVTAANVRGDVKIATMNGRIVASGLTGNAKFDTMNGSIEAKFDRLGAGQKVSLDSMNGSCTIDVPTDASARIVASTMNGRVRSDVPVKLEKSSRRTLRGAIGAGEGRIELDSMNGSLTVRARS
jgi:hypothetical protein